MKEHSLDSEDTKRKILYAAKKEFAAKGFSGARMSSIASIAGVNQALLHYHFTSKEKIYITIFRRLLDAVFGIYEKRILDLINSWNAGPDIRLCSVIYVMVNSEIYIRDDEFQRIVAFGFAEGNGIIYEMVREYMAPQLFLFDDIIMDGVENGLFEISNTAMLTMNIITFIKDVAQGEEFFRDTELYITIYKDKHEKLYNFMIEFVFKALRPAGKKLKIPVLDQEKKNELDSILIDLRNNINKNF